MATETPPTPTPPASQPHSRRLEVSFHLGQSPDRLRLVGNGGDVRRCPVLYGTRMMLVK